MLTAKSILPKVLVVLLVIILASLCFTGCKDDDVESSGGPPQPNLPSQTGTIPGSGGEVSGKDSTAYSFTPDKTAVWNFDIEYEGDGDIHLELIGPDGNSITESVYAEYLESGKNYSVILSLYTYYGGSPLSFVLKVYTAPEIPGSGGEMRVEKRTTFSFTPDRSGIWTFRTSDNDGVDTFLNINDSGAGEIHGYDSGRDKDDGNSLVTLQLEQGETYRVGAGFYLEEAGSYTLSVSAPESIPDGGGDVKVDNTAVFAFSPDSSGAWIFSTSGGSGGDPYLTVFGPDGNEIASAGNIMYDKSAFITLYLESGKTYSVNADCIGGSGSYVLSASPADAIPGEGGEFAVSEASGFFFTPDRSGIWEFSTAGSGGSDPFVMVYDVYRCVAWYDSAGAGEAAVSVYLDKGEPLAISLLFENQGGSTLNVKFVNEVATLQSGAQIPANGGEFRVNAPDEFTFTPDQGGVWAFYISDNGRGGPTLTIEDSAGGIAGFANTPAGKTWTAASYNEMKAGEKYAVTTALEKDASGSFLVRAERPAPLPSVGGAARIERVTVYTFMPSQSGTWEFRTLDAGMADPALNIKDLNEENIGYGFGEKELLVSVELTAGETYIVLAGYYGDTFGSYMLTFAAK